MKTKNHIAGIALRNIYFFIIFIILSYCLSEVTVRGASMIAEAVNQLISGEAVDIRGLGGSALTLILIAVAVAFVKYVSGSMFAIRIQKECRETAAISLSSAKAGYIENSSGMLITVITSDIAEVEVLFSEILPEIFYNTIMIITLSISIIMMDLKLMLGIVICYPPVLFISGRISENINALAKKRRNKYDDLTKAAQDAVLGITIERSFGLYDVLNERINIISEDILKNEYVRNRIQAISNAIETLMKWLPNVICTIIALTEVFEGKLTIGELMAFEVLFTKIAAPVSELPFRINDAREAMVSVRRINALINAPKEEGGTCMPDCAYSGTNAIILDNVSYQYDINPDRKILDKLSLSFEKGKTTAIVGSSGAGKSTLFKILCGFESPDEGEYRLMGEDFHRLNLDAARAQIAIVPQNAFLFPATIAENVSYGRDGASDELIEKACKTARIHEYITTLPKGYETMLGERGVNMSGGERQRICIARALLKDAPVILMDEPTSALDDATQAEITNILESKEFKKDKTIIIIAHRLSTVMNADKIIVLDKGRAAETGTHEELADRGGIYAALYKRESDKEFAGEV